MGSAGGLMTLHTVKVDPHWHRLLVTGIKTCEIRYDDRDYQAGDRIRFHVEGSKYYTREWDILHVLKHVTGLQDGYVILSLKHPDTAYREEEGERLRARTKRLERSNAALRGVITRMRKVANR